VAASALEFSVSYFFPEYYLQKVRIEWVAFLTIYIYICRERCIFYGVVSDVYCTKLQAESKPWPNCKCALLIPLNRKVVLMECNYCPTVPGNGGILLLEDFLASYFCGEVKHTTFFRLDERHMGIFIFGLAINITPQEVRIKEQKRFFIFALFLNEFNKLFSLVLGSGRPT